MLFQLVLFLRLNHSDKLRIEVHLIIVRLLLFILASIKTVVEIILVLSVKNLPIFVIINRLNYQALLSD